MTLTVPVTDAVLARLRERAAACGTTPEAVAADALARAVPPRPRSLSDPPLSRDEFRRLLDEMASLGTGKVLPPDFSRADIYDDHD